MPKKRRLHKLEFHSLVSILVLSIGCSGSVNAKRTVAAANNSCAGRVTAMKSWMQQFVADDAGLEVRDIPLLTLRGAVPARRGMVFSLDGGQGWMPYRHAKDLNKKFTARELGTRLRELNIIPSLGFHHPIYLALGPSVRWKDVRDFLRAARFLQGQVGFLFAKRRQAKTPRVSSLTKALKGKQNLAQMASVLIKAFAPCKALTKDLHALGRLGGSSKMSRWLAESLPESTADCKCAVDPDVVSSAFWAMSQGGDRTYTVATVFVRPKSPTATKLAFSNDAKWSDVAPKILEIARSNNTSVTFPDLPKK